MIPISILVPIYGESIETINRLLNSIQAQINIRYRQVRIVCLVNNGPISKVDQNTYLCNQQALRYLKSLELDNLFLIDRSSNGCEVPCCNIGKARQLLIEHEFSYYSSLQTNGILLNVDADSFLEDVEFIAKLISYYETGVIAVSGGKNRKVFLEKYISDHTREDIIEAFKIINLAKQCKELCNFIKGERVHEAFGGSNMSALCFESNKVGFKPYDVGEDKDFGERMATYSELTGSKIVYAKVDFKVSAEMRLSGRTGSSFTDDIMYVLSGGKLSIQGWPFKEEGLVNEQNYGRLAKHVRAMPDGNDVLEYIEDYGQLDFI